MADLFPLWAKIVRYVLSEEAYWTNQTDETGSTLTGDFPPLEAVSRECRVTFGRTEPTGVSDDRALFSLHFVKDTGDGTLGIPWADADYTTLENALDTWWTAVKGYVSSHWTLADYEWRAFGTDRPTSVKTGARTYSPLLRRTTKNVAATSATYLPDQCAATVTFRTALRRHWGRVYMPPFSGGAVDTYGRLTTTYVDAVCGAFHTLLTTADTAHLRPVVWSPMHSAALTILHLTMDNVPDVIRSRRAKYRTYLKQFDS